MIRKLKVKMILLSGIALLILLTLTVIGVNIFAYRSLIRDADKTLEFALHEYISPNNTIPPPQNTEYDSFGYRYFFVMIGHDGQVKEIDTSRLPSISDNDGLRMAEEISNKTKNGFLSDFRYSVTELSEGKLVIMLDCSQIHAIVATFILTSTIIAASTFSLALTLISVLAKRILRPISESYEKQKRFITDAGHEIKTPLSVINANVDLLMMDMEDNEALVDIKQQTARLTTLTNDLIMLSKMGEEIRNEIKVDFPLSEVVKEACELFDVPAKADGKVINKVIAPLFSMNGDMRSISHLVSILMDNAVKYSPKNSEINVTLSKYGKAALLTVENSTEYVIEREMLPRIFDRFYRADPSRNSKSGGHGIGLSIAEAIVSSHGGKIFAVSGGTHHFKIKVYLPIHAV